MEAEGIHRCSALAWPPSLCPFVSRAHAGWGWRHSGDRDVRAQCGCCLTTVSCPHAGIVEIRSVRVGTVVIKAVDSGFYVAMNRRGHLYGSVSDQPWAVTGW